MATFLLTWELGQGLGHVVNLRPLAEGLRHRGHRVALALQDLSRAPRFIQASGIEYWQAPLKQWRTASAGPTLTFAHVLRENGFDDAEKLAGLVAGWNSIQQRVQPDAIVFDHSPTALLAARGFASKRVHLGTGFFCPLDESPLRSLQPWIHPDAATLIAMENVVLQTINQVLAGRGQPPLARVAQLYHPYDEHLLVTFAELDHYADRPAAHYWGAWPSGFGKPPVWPAGSGKRIYAYLKSFPELPRLLELLRRSALPTIVYCDGIGEEMQRRFAAPTLRFENEPLDMTAVGRDCDWAILNGNHGTAVAILLAGKPALHIPIHVEQALLVNAILRIGACLGASPVDGQHLEMQFNQMLVDQSCAAGARAFASRYATYDPATQISTILDRLEELAAAK